MDRRHSVFCSIPGSWIRRLEPQSGLSGTISKTYCRAGRATAGRSTQPVQLSTIRSSVRRTGRPASQPKFTGLGCGVSHTTAREWLRLYWKRAMSSSNFSPISPILESDWSGHSKLYFYDVGLASYLIGIENARQIATHPLRGSLFENDGRSRGAQVSFQQRTPAQPVFLPRFEGSGVRSVL